MCLPHRTRFQWNKHKLNFILLFDFQLALKFTTRCFYQFYWSPESNNAKCLWTPVTPGMNRTFPTASRARLRGPPLGALGVGYGRPCVAPWPGVPSDRTPCSPLEPRVRSPAVFGPGPVMFEPRPATVASVRSGVPLPSTPPPPAPGPASEEGQQRELGGGGQVFSPANDR